MYSTHSEVRLSSQPGPGAYLGGVGAGLEAAAHPEYAAVVAARVAAQQRVRQRALARAGGAHQHHAGGGVLRGGGRGQA